MCANPALVAGLRASRARLAPIPNLPNLVSHGCDEVLLAPLLVAVHYLRPAWGLAMKRDKPGMYRRIVTQYVGTYGVHAGMLSLAVWSYGLQAGLRVWALSLGIGS